MKLLVRRLRQAWPDVKIVLRGASGFCRRVIAKAEHTDQGSNPRFVVTHLEGDAQALCDEVYCARGEMENRIKEQQLGLLPTAPVVTGGGGPTRSGCS